MLTCIQIHIHKCMHVHTHTQTHLHMKENILSFSFLEHSHYHICLCRWSVESWRTESCHDICNRFQAWPNFASRIHHVEDNICCWEDLPIPQHFRTAKSYATLSQHPAVCSEREHPLAVVNPALWTIRSIKRLIIWKKRACCFLYFSLILENLHM